MASHELLLHLGLFQLSYKTPPYMDHYCDLPRGKLCNRDREDSPWHMLQEAANAIHFSISYKIVPNTVTVYLAGNVHGEYSPKIVFPCC